MKPTNLFKIKNNLFLCLYIEKIITGEEIMTMDFGNLYTQDYKINTDRKTLKKLADFINNYLEKNNDCQK
jgi:hypothetical protein